MFPTFPNGLSQSLFFLCNWTMQPKKRLKLPMEYKIQQFCHNQQKYLQINIEENLCG